MFAPRRRMRKHGADAITPVGKTPRHDARARQGVQDAQQARLRDAGEDIELLQRGIGLHLQRLQDEKASLEALDHFRSRHPCSLRSTLWNIPFHNAECTSIFLASCRRGVQMSTPAGCDLKLESKFSSSDGGHP